MSSFWHKPIPLRCFIAFFVLFICYTDWGYFFPLSTHGDLKFQVVGEAIEVIVLSLLLAILRYLQKNSGEATQLTADRAALIGLAFAAFLFFDHWREFFPNHQFSGAKLMPLLFETVMQGALFGLFLYAFQGPSRRPSKQDEKSVV